MCGYEGVTYKLSFRRAETLEVTACHCEPEGGATINAFPHKTRTQHTQTIANIQGRARRRKGTYLDVTDLHNTAGSEAGSLHAGSRQDVVLLVLGRDLGGSHVLDGLAALENATDGELGSRDHIIVACLPTEGYRQ